MAIATMKQLTLVALDADREKIFDALIRSNAVHLRKTAQIDACTSLDNSDMQEDVLHKVALVEEAIAYISSTATKHNSLVKKHDASQVVELPKNSMARPRTELTFDYFLGFGKKVDELEGVLQQLKALREQNMQLSVSLTQLQAEVDKHALYEMLPHKTDWYTNTDQTIVQLCLAQTNNLHNILRLAEQMGMVEVQVVDSSKSTAVVVVVAHKSQSDFFAEAMPLGLVKSNFVCDKLPAVVLADLNSQICATQEQIEQNTQTIAQLAQYVGDLKVYVDYLGLQRSKLQAESSLQLTGNAFVLEGYFPEERLDKVFSALKYFEGSIVVDVKDVGKDDWAPTLVESNKVVEPFQFVTNMYTPPSYQDIDPNPPMSIFYFIIFGLMVADIGYGLVLLLIGLFATLFIKQRTGVKSLLQVFGFCGLSAIAVGFLFGSFFCYTIIPPVIPDPSKYPMVLIIISLYVGIIHIIGGIACKMMHRYKHNDKLAAWLVDFPWTVVLASLMVALWNMALDMAAYPPYDVIRLPKIATDVGLYVCLGALAVALVFAGLGQKGFFAKIKSSFGSAYGIINYFSDVMSYIRIFGLMLSSALMGSVMNDIAVMTGPIGAVPVLIFGHAFNLVMGLMSVYIHNGRLAYVEFFGRFYTGDGTLFAPFGTTTKYTLLKD